MISRSAQTTKEAPAPAATFKSQRSRAVQTVADKPAVLRSTSAQATVDSADATAQSATAPEPVEAGSQTEEEAARQLCDCGRRRPAEVAEVLANRGEEYCVLYRDSAEPVWERGSALDDDLIRNFKERSKLPNPHAATATATAAESDAGSSVRRSGRKKRGSPASPSASNLSEKRRQQPARRKSVMSDGGGGESLATEMAAEAAGEEGGGGGVDTPGILRSRRKSGTPTKWPKGPASDGLYMERRSRRKPVNPSKVAAEQESPLAVISEVRTGAADEAIESEALATNVRETEPPTPPTPTPVKRKRGRPPRNPKSPNLKQPAPSNLVVSLSGPTPAKRRRPGRPRKEERSVVAAEAKDDATWSPSPEGVSGRGRRSKVKALTNFKKWNLSGEDDGEDDDQAVETSAEKRVPEPVANSIECSPPPKVSPMKLPERHRKNYRSPEDMEREKVKLEKEEARRRALLMQKLSGELPAGGGEDGSKKGGDGGLLGEDDFPPGLANSDDEGAKPIDGEILSELDDDGEGGGGRRRRSSRSTAGKKTNTSLDADFETGDDVIELDDEDEVALISDKPADPGVIELGGKGQPTTLVQAANIQLGIVPKRKRGRPPKQRDAQGNPLPSTPKSAAGGATPKQRGRRPRVMTNKASSEIVGEVASNNPLIPSNVNLLNDLMQTSDEDKDDESPSGGLTIKPVESPPPPSSPSPTPASKRGRRRAAGSSLKMVLGGRKTSAATRPRRKKQRIDYNESDDEDIDEPDYSEDGGDEEEEDDDHDGREGAVPANLQRIVPPGFEMVRHLNEKGNVEYRVRKAADYASAMAASTSASAGGAVARKSLPPRPESSSNNDADVDAVAGSSPSSASKQQPKLVEIGLRRRSSASKETSSSNVIFVGESKQQQHQQQQSVSATKAAEEPSGSSSGKYVRLTYKPTDEDLDGSSTSPTAVKRQQPQQRRVSPRANEVTSTTDGDDFKVGTKKICIKNIQVYFTFAFQIKGLPTVLDVRGGGGGSPATECNLDPTSGILVDKDGNPFQADTLGSAMLGSASAGGAADGTGADGGGGGGLVMLPSSGNVLSPAQPQQQGPPSQRPEQVIVNLQQGTDDTQGTERKGLINEHGFKLRICIVSFANLSTVNPDGTVNQQQPPSFITAAGVPTSQLLNSSVGGLDPQAFTSAMTAAGSMPTLQLADDGSGTLSVVPPFDGSGGGGGSGNPVNIVSNLAGVAGGGEQFMATAAGIAPGGGADGTTNKVLLVLPGGQMILTDLTDEQCSQLNIQVLYILEAFMKLPLITIH